MCEYQETTCVDELLFQYRTSLTEIRKLLRDISRKIEPMERIYSNPRVNEIDRLKAREEAAPLLLDKSIIKSWEGNLLYCIDWMVTGRRPGSRRGAERRAGYEIEIPFETHWIQRRKDNKETDCIETIEDDHSPDSKLQKEHLVTKMTECLSKRQKEILQLAGNGYSHEEIAKLLGVHKGTVSRTIARAKEKILDEGWFMV
ncbi:sigma-70 family RNA polymerase sigma factor [Schinkia azotoformans]|uniref:sigma-70 family RNA polymerase sigma factor n=1 Tax=Schinkia azotoformans TaxID=1454 RepID=UPI002DBC248B|nr:sigma-70 family RNA polymerase sigma factor [Schinkia azotoformans]MEC1744134.1 sigma-70 family RNA polymerase sigma factor [Schinkia azotoformans]